MSGQASKVEAKPAHISVGRIPQVSSDHFPVIAIDSTVADVREKVKQVFNRWRKVGPGPEAESGELERIADEFDSCLELLLRIAKLRRYAPEKKPLDRWSMILKVDKEYPALGVKKRFQVLLTSLQKVPHAPDLRIRALALNQPAQQAELLRIEQLMNEPSLIDELGYEDLTRMYPVLIGLADRETRRLLDSLQKAYAQSPIVCVTPVQFRETLGPSQALVSYRILRNLADELQRWSSERKNEIALAHKLVALNWPEALNRLGSVFPNLVSPEPDVVMAPPTEAVTPKKRKSRQSHVQTAS